MVRRLRTLTGCGTCRVKRIKCDEAKPRCKFCQRHNLTCTYGAASSNTVQKTSANVAQAMQQHNLTAGPVQRLPLTKSPSQTTQIFTDQSHFDMTAAWPSSFAISLPPGGKTVAGVVPTIMRLSFHSQPLSAAIAAIMSDTMCAYTSEARFARLSCDMYLRSVVWLRQDVSRNGPTQDPVHLLITAMVLGILEATSFGDLNAASHHLVASMSLWARSLQLHMGDVEVVNTLRMSLEGCLHFMSIMSIVLPDQALSAIMAVLQWNAINSVYVEPLGPKVMRCEYSVHRSLPYELARLVLRVTQACRNADSVTPDIVDTWEWDIEKLEADRSTYYSTEGGKPYPEGIVVGDMYLCAIRILVRHVRNPDGCSSDPIIRQLNDQACEILDGDILRNNITTTVFWPLVVVLCALRERAKFDSLVARSETFSFNGAFLGYWTFAVHAVRQARLQAPCDNVVECNGVHDGLRLLLREDGILAGMHGAAANHASRRFPSRGRSWTWKEGEVMKV